jgi:DNA-binding transcriptional regulator YhcF (GntR family)
MNSPATAYAIVKDRLESGDWKPGMRLPILTEMARFCGVSRSTMWKATALLRSNALIHGKPGGALFAGPSKLQALKSSQGNCAWERLKIKIGNDILQGNFTPHAQLIQGKLALHYRINVRTLAKALDRLVHEGILSKEGCRYYQTHNFIRRYRMQIMLLSFGDAAKGISTMGDHRTQQIAQCFEHECSRLGIRYRCEGFNHSLPDAVLKSLKIAKMKNDNTGYIVNLWNPRNEKFWQRWIDLLRFLVDCKAPVVVLDQDGDLRFPQEFYSRNNFRVLRIAGNRAGEAVALNLLSSGHKQVAFIRNASDLQWEQIRLAGMMRYYSQYGGPDAVIENYALSEYGSSSIDRHKELLASAKIEICNLFKESLSQNEQGKLAACLDKIEWSTSEKKAPSGMIAKAVHAISAIIKDTNREKHDPWIFGLELINTIYALSINMRTLFLCPLFSMVLKKSSATAWVCSNDQIAVAALSFLKSQKISVPDAISVVGFENWHEASEMQLSTFDFNMNGMVQQALQMILDEKLMKSMLPITEVDGIFVERTTTKKNYKAQPGTPSPR